MLNLPNLPKILADTRVNGTGVRVVTFMVTIPTCILKEFRTHKVVNQLNELYYEGMHDHVTSMSANSDRAIPVNKKIKDILSNPYIPIMTGKQAGMQGNFNLDEQTVNEAVQTHLKPLSNWESGDSDLQKMITKFNELGIHKQVINRHLEPWSWSTLILTASEWQNFFNLRCPVYTYKGITANSVKMLKMLAPELRDKDSSFFTGIRTGGAEPAFAYIAELMYDLYIESEPNENTKLHLPFRSDIEANYKDEIREFLLRNSAVTGVTNKLDMNDWYEFILCCISSSLCAKISYNTHEKEDTLEKHLSRAILLYNERHMEPFSHNGKIMTEKEFDAFKRVELEFDRNNDPIEVITNGWCHNMRGIMTTRYLLESSTPINNKFKDLITITNAD